jgi:hypothetical protein
MKFSNPAASTRRPDLGFCINALLAVGVVVAFVHGLHFT